MNLVILSGNIVKIYNNGNNVRIVIADNYKDRTDYITVNTFGTLAANVLKYMTVGDHVSIDGRASTYKSSSGSERTSIIANRVNFEGYRNPNKPRAQAPAQPTAPPTGFVDIPQPKADDQVDWNDLQSMI